MLYVCWLTLRLDLQCFNATDFMYVDCRGIQTFPQVQQSSSSAFAMHWSPLIWFPYGSTLLETNQFNSIFGDRNHFSIWSPISCNFKKSIKSISPEEKNNFLFTRSFSVSLSMCPCWTLLIPELFFQFEILTFFLLNIFDSALVLISLLFRT